MPGHPASDRVNPKSYLCPLAAQRPHQVPDGVLGLGDGGAHCGLICDASLTTFMLSHWVRGRTRGDRVPLAQAVHRMTQHTAQMYDLFDRGVVAPGYRADLNVIDPERIELRRPEMVYDLPGDGRRLIQKVDGYRYTIKSGEVIYQDGEPTGALPGKLVRGPQVAPEA